MAAPATGDGVGVGKGPAARFVAVPSLPADQLVAIAGVPPLPGRVAAEEKCLREVEILVDVVGGRPGLGEPGEAAV